MSTPVSILPLATRTLQYRADLLVEASRAAIEHEHASDEARAWWILNYVLDAAAWKCALADERANAAVPEGGSPATPKPPNPLGVAGIPKRHPGLACGTCGGIVAHVLGCPEMDAPR